MTNLSRIRIRSAWVEWLIIFVVIYLFCRATLLDFNPQQLQQTGEHNESATLPLLAEIGLWRYGEIPLWNPYMLTGFPHAGDLINHFWNPVATIPVILWGGINGMKVSVFLSLLVAAYGQWFLAHTFGARGMFRLWAGLLFGLCGGLALLWRLGWYELLVGAAWFPWCFALVWRALHRRDWLSVALAAASIYMVLTTGGGYYPFYLGVSLITLTLVALYWHKPEARGRQFGRAVAVALLGAGLAAVYLTPLVDGIRLTGRDAPPDVNQVDSQPIPYALFNYVVSDEAWFTTVALNRGSGYSWHYIGGLPLLALAATSWLFARFRWRRRTILTLLALLLVLLLWHANRYMPVRWLYDTFPYLLTFRFPQRLLIIAASPLIVLAAVTLQGLLVRLRRGQRGYAVRVSSANSGKGGGLPIVMALNVAAALLLLVSLTNVYQVNKRFAMHPSPRLAAARDVLGWLRLHDPGTYYISLGHASPYWNYVPFAYELEMPVINFRYNRRVLSMDAQLADGSPFRATPKYIITGQSEGQPPDTVLVETRGSVSIWQRPDALPFAFTTDDPAGAITADTVEPQTGRNDGPNRVVVDADGGKGGAQLVVLVSDYPGWRVRVDGRPAELAPVNGYLGARMPPGDHAVVFEFRPPLHYIGLAISLLTAALCVGLVVAERRTKRADHSRPAIDPA